MKKTEMLKKNYEFKTVLSKGKFFKGKEIEIFILKNNKKRNFLGIAIGLFLYLAMLSNYSSFGVPYLSPYVPYSNVDNSGYFLSPMWKREKRSDYLNTKRRNKQAKVSMKWKI